MNSEVPCFTWQVPPVQVRHRDFNTGFSLKRQQLRKRGRTTPKAQVVDPDYLKRSAKSSHSYKSEF